MLPRLAQAAYTSSPASWAQSVRGLATVSAAQSWVPRNLASTRLPSLSSHYSSSSGIRNALSKQLYSSSPLARTNGSASTSSSSPSIQGCLTLNQQRASPRIIVSRKYTSSSTPSSSSSSSSATAARLVAEEASQATATASTTTATASASASAASKVKPTLTFHEEMTKVRFSYNWWKEWTIIMGVFAVTGSSTVMVVKPLLKDVLKLEGSMREGPWSFRIIYLTTTLPLYSCILLTVATVAGRRPYFKVVVLRMWGRLLPKKVVQRFQ